MNEAAHPGVAIVGVGSILPDAPDATAFWHNVKDGRYSITEVPKERWDPNLYYDPDPRAPNKTYSKIGGWVKDGEWDWEPLAWRIPIPPTVGDTMDVSQKWAVVCTRAALRDYGFPERQLATDRTAVIFGNALAGDKQFHSSLRIQFPEFETEFLRAAELLALPPEMQEAVLTRVRAGIAGRYGEITGDTAVGELSNILTGRVANLFDFHGPNYTMDAACASALSALNASVKGLVDGDFDVAVTGGIDANMGPVPFVKFAKIGALSATGTRPYDAGADGFVMGEGAAVFLLKRLADAERDDDRIYAVIRGIAGSSDGKGRGMTAPNPAGQRLAVRWAWERAGLSPATVSLIEGHGTSTALGDVVEVETLHEVFGGLEIPTGSIALGSAKSNIGHLKAAAGAAGLLKAVFALDEKVLPPSINFERPNPNIDWAHSPFFVNKELREWEAPACGIRRMGVSAFGFGGTNFHAVLDEYVPGTSNGGGPRAVAVPKPQPRIAEERAGIKPPPRGVLVLGADSVAELSGRLRSVEAAATSGKAPAAAAPAEADLRSAERVAIDFGTAAELAEKTKLALKAMADENAATWHALRGRGIYRGSGPAPAVAFLYTGQGSQYVNMLANLRASEPVVAGVFDAADSVTTRLLGTPLSNYIFVEETDPGALEAAEAELKQTDVTQPAVLTADVALGKLLGEYGIAPAMVMGHSMGEYAALVAAGCLTFENALEAVIARGRAVAGLSVEDPGRMAAVLGPPAEIAGILESIDGYVIVANFNSHRQTVISGASEAVSNAIEKCIERGYRVVPLAISHAFHTEIVAPACDPLRKALGGLGMQPAQLPVVSNVDGGFYPTGPDGVSRMLELLTQQIASPVRFITGVQTLYEADARVFVELGPKTAVHGLVENILADQPDVVSLFTNSPKLGDVVSFNHALCGMYAAGLGRGAPDVEVPVTPVFSDRSVAAAATPGPMVGRVRATDANEGTTVETVIDPKAQPFLWDHRLDGTALLPGVMGVEAFAEVAKFALPDWHVAAIEDMRFQAAFKFYRDEPRTLLLRTVLRPEGDEMVAECTLIGERKLRVSPEPLVTTHFTGRVRLTRSPMEPMSIEPVTLPRGPFIDAASLYKVYFHGPSYQVVERAWPEVSADTAVGVFAEGLPPDHTPESAPLLSSPRLIELCFQTIGTWELSAKGRFAIPHSLDRVVVFGGSEARPGPLVASVTARDDGERFDATVVDASGNVCVELEGYRSVELPGAVGPDELAIFRTAGHQRP